MAALKLPIADLRGTYAGGVLVTEKGYKIARAWISGMVVRKRSEKFLSLLVDDGTGVMQVRAFENIERFNCEPGDIVEAAGRLKEYNGRIYIVPDFVRKISPNNELLRRLEALWVRKKLETGEIEPEPDYVKQPTAETGEKEAVETAKKAESEIDEEKGTENAADNTDLKEVVRGALEEEMTIYQIQEKTGIKEEVLSEIFEELLDNGDIFEPKPGKFKKI